MTPKPPFLCAADYVFYIKKHSEPEAESSINKHNKMSTLLRKLSEDICEGPIGFVEDFIEEPNEGVSALLDYLKISLNRQQSPISMPYISNGMSNEMNKFSNYNQAQRNRDRQQLMKRAMNDEYDCLQCLKHAIIRNDATLNKILVHKSGLTSLGSCIVSNLVKSRIIALEILTKMCNVQPEGYSKVLEAMTIMRILFGESVRFKLLVALVNSNSMNFVQKLNYRSEQSEKSSTTDSECDAQSNCIQFELVVLRFINALLANAQPAQRVRLQTEIEEAGFSINFLEQKLNQGLQESQESKIKIEIKNYKKLYIDVSKLMLNCQQALQRETELKEDVDNLHYALDKLEKEKIDLLQKKQELKERCSELEDELKKIKKRCMNSNSSLDSKKSLANQESNRSASDISNNGINNSTNSDSGRWSTSDSEEEKRMQQQQQQQQQESVKKPSYFKLNLMNSMKKNKEISVGLSKFKTTGSAKSKSDQNLENLVNKKEINQSSNKNEENVRNEDIFIYVPTIREKNVKQSIESLTNKTNTRIFETNRTNNNNKNFLNRLNSMNCGEHWSTNKIDKITATNQELNKSQSNISSNSSTSSQKSNKPQIINVYPKRSNSIGELLSDQSKNSDDDKDEEEIKKLYCLRKQIANSSVALKQTENDHNQINLTNNKSYKANLQNSIDTLSTNNSLSEDNNDDYEELIASTLQQKRIVKENNNQTIWSNEDESMLNSSNKINNLRGNKLYASFANGQLINDKIKPDYNSSSLFRTGGQYYSTATTKTNKSTSNLSNANLSNCNLSISSSAHNSQNALINGEFYLRKGRQSSINSLNNDLNKFESSKVEPPSIYGKHLNTLSKDKYKKLPQSELEIQKTSHSSTLQHKKERNLTGKKIASQLQSYFFFSGSVSNKKKSVDTSKSTSNIKKQINDLNEKFPLPNAYKKNFILKGHLNVGLYSNQSNKKPQDQDLSSLNVDMLNYREDESINHSTAGQPNSLNIHELQTKSSKSFKNKGKINKSDITLVENSCINLGLNSLVSSSHGLSNSVSDVHREIAIAAKELGAWY